MILVVSFTDVEWQRLINRPITRIILIQALIRIWQLALFPAVSLGGPNSSTLNAR